MMMRRAVLVLLLICLGCSAQAPPAGQGTQAAPGPPADLGKLIERHVRAQYTLPPDVRLTLGALRASEFAGFDELTITFDSPERKQTYQFLLSHDHKTLARLTRMDLTQDPYAEVMKKIDVTGRPVRGNKDAKVVVVNYDDFECPYCARMHATLFPEIFKEYQDRVLFIYKDYPLEEIHPWAVHAAVNANCLAAQNADAYWSYADYLHGNQHPLGSAKGRDAQNAELDRLAILEGQKRALDEAKLGACIKAQDEKPVRTSMREGDALGVNATPTMYVNGEKMDGAVPAELVREALDRALTDAGVAAPDHKAGGQDSKGTAASK
jgi:protein-disulfide isomerase